MVPRVLHKHRRSEWLLRARSSAPGACCATASSSDVLINAALQTLVTADKRLPQGQAPPPLAVAAHDIASAMRETPGGYHQIVDIRK